DAQTAKQSRSLPNPRAAPPKVQESPAASAVVRSIDLDRATGDRGELGGALGSMGSNATPDRHFALALNGESVTVPPRCPPTAWAPRRAEAARPGRPRASRRPHAREKPDPAPARPPPVSRTGSRFEARPSTTSR